MNNISNKWVAKLKAASLLLVMLGLTACIPKNEDELVVNVSKNLAPEGSVTKTHFFINWPAIYYNGKLQAPPLQLKIPIEYLPPTYVGEPPKSLVMQRIFGTLWDERDDELKRINLEITYGAKPIVSEYIPHYTDEQWNVAKQDEALMASIAKKNLAKFNIWIDRDLDLRGNDMDYPANLTNQRAFFYDSKYHRFQVKWYLKGHVVCLTGIAYALGRDYLITDEKRVVDKNPRYKVPAFPVDETIQPHTELKDWHEIAEPARALLESFVVNETTSNSTN
jgi:hypothetical protein